MTQANDRYTARNEVVELKPMMSVADLVKHCKMHGISLDAIMVFRENQKDGKSERNVASVLESHKAGELSWIILGGWL